MGFLRNMKMAAEANRQMTEFRRLAPLGGSPTPAEVGLHQLADLGRSMGLTSGDCGKLAVELLRQIDARGAYAAAETALLADYDSGRLTTLPGPPMKQFVQRDAVARYLRAVAERFRPAQMEPQG